MRRVEQGHKVRFDISVVLTFFIFKKRPKTNRQKVHKKGKLNSLYHNGKQVDYRDLASF